MVCCFWWASVTFLYSQFCNSVCINRVDKGTPSFFRLNQNAQDQKFSSFLDIGLWLCCSVLSSAIGVDLSHAAEVSWCDSAQHRTSSTWGTYQAVREDFLTVMDVHWETNPQESQSTTLFLSCVVVIDLRNAWWIVWSWSLSPFCLFSPLILSHARSFLFTPWSRSLPVCLFHCLIVCLLAVAITTE